MNKKLLLTIIWLDRRRLSERAVSSLSLNLLISNSGYSINRNNDSIVKQFKEQIQFLIDNNIISIKGKLMDYKPTDLLDIKLVKPFYEIDVFTRIFPHEVDALLQSPAKIDKSKLFAIYLYIKSFMKIRKLGDDGNEFKDAKDNPSAFWGAINSIVTDTGISKETINKCLKEYLRLGLFKRHVVGSYVTKHGEGIVRINVPNIYVINQEGYEQEIEWAIDKIKAFHGAQSFDPPALRGRKKKCLEVSETVND